MKGGGVSFAPWNKAWDVLSSRFSATSATRDGGRGVVPTSFSFVFIEEEMGSREEAKGKEEDEAGGEEGRDKVRVVGEEEEGKEEEEGFE